MPPGVPCIDFKGDQTPRPHKTRGPGQHEKHLAEAEARRIGREKASYGPLFQEIAEAEVPAPRSAEELKWAERRAIAASFDSTGGPRGMALTEQANKGLEYLWIHSMFREIGKRTNDNWECAFFAAFTYGFGNGIEYVPSRLKAALTTTEPHIFAYFRVENPDHPYKIATTVPALVWAPSEPLMTVEEFEERFKKPDHWRGLKDAPEPDDGGLFDRTIAALGR
jgi:hypothetical protein